MNPSREQLIGLRFEQGMTREDIAEHFDVSIATVRRWIKEMDIPRPRRSQKPKQKNLTRLGEIIAPAGDGRNRMERAQIVLGGRLIEKIGFGYYLDGYPADIDTILAAAGT